MSKQLYLVHHGVTGMKWGVRRYQNEDGTLTVAGKKRYTVGEDGDLIKKPKHRSNSLSALLARRKNQKVDEGFDNWKINVEKRDRAISLGKEWVQTKMAYESDSSNLELKTIAKNNKKEYKKALKENTTYRKGVVRQEVGKDLSRKLLSEAKRVQKDLLSNPGNKSLKKRYNNLMSEHDKARAKARKAPEVSQKRSKKIASLRRARTMAAKGAVASGVIVGGTIGVNAILKRKGYSGITKEGFAKVVKSGKRIFEAKEYFY